MKSTSMSRLPTVALPEILTSPEASAEALAVYAHWSDLVERIRTGETSGIEELYGLFSRGVRDYLARNVGTEALETRVQDTILAVRDRIKRGKYAIGSG